MSASGSELLEPAEVLEVVRCWATLDRRFANAVEARMPPAQALTRLGVDLCLQDRYVEALGVLRAAESLSPRDPELLNNLAVVLERAEQTEQAISVLGRSLAMCREQADSWMFLATLRKKQGDLAGAKTAYETTLSLEPQYALAWQGLGLIQQELGEHEDAIRSIITSIKQSQVTGPVLAILGQLFYMTGQFEKSRDAYEAAVGYDGQNATSRQMLGETEFLCVALRGGSLEEALGAYQAERAARPEEPGRDTHELLQITFSLLNGYGHREGAQRVGELRAKLFPSSATAAYLLRAVSGDSTVGRAPDAYVVECFDRFAGSFDRHLVETLGYDIPQKLVAALAGVRGERVGLDGLDAGCGTGLCGPLVRGWCGSLTGVDLSPVMLEHAGRRQVYDRLVCRELTGFLNDSAGCFDLVVAADVMIYFGDLGALAGGIARAL